MQAIETKYLSPSNVRGARIKASCEAKTKIYHWDHALDADGNHRAAARCLIDELGWHGSWVSGTIPSLPHSYVHVCRQRHEYERTPINGAEHVRGTTQMSLRWKGSTEGFDVWPE